MKIYALIVCEKEEMCVPCMFQMVDHWAKKKKYGKRNKQFFWDILCCIMFYGSSLTTCSKYNLCIYLIPIETDCFLLQIVWLNLLYCYLTFKESSTCKHKFVKKEGEFACENSICCG